MEIMDIVFFCTLIFYHPRLLYVIILCYGNIFNEEDRDYVKHTTKLFYLNCKSMCLNDAVCRATCFDFYWIHLQALLNVCRMYHFFSPTTHAFCCYKYAKILLHARVSGSRVKGDSLATAECGSRGTLGVSVSHRSNILRIWHYWRTLSDKVLSQFPPHHPNSPRYSFIDLW